MLLNKICKYAVTWEYVPHDIIADIEQNIEFIKNATKVLENIEWKFWLKFDPLFWLKMTHLQIKIVPLFFVILIF